MAPIAKAMNAQQVRDVSAYYANIGATAAGAPGTPAAGSGRGRAQQLATVGDNAVRVQACTNCHGPGGAGEPPIYPYLAGQHPSYLTAAMQAWKSGARKTDSSGQMPQIARALSDADVAALSDWFAAQPAPLQPAAKMTNIPAGSTLKPTVAAAAGAPGPSSGAAAGVTGSGTEQGAPVTGGGQGPGGGGGTQGTQPPAPPVKR
jgi:cytochrome c553